VMTISFAASDFMRKMNMVPRRGDLPDEHFRQRRGEPLRHGAAVGL